MRTAERSETNSRLVTLTVNDLVPEGATLLMQKKAFDRKASGTISQEIASDLDEASVVLASQALVVGNDVFYDAPVTAPVTDADRDAAVQGAPRGARAPAPAAAASPLGRHWQCSTSTYRRRSCLRRSCGRPSPA